MPIRVVFSQQAIRQLDDLEGYIADRSYPERAIRYTRRLIRFCNRLGLAPNTGQLLELSRAGVRSVGFERRITVYFQASPMQVTVLGIYYAGRQPGPHDLDDMP